MKLAEFDYNLPPELIAQEPATPRDHSRLLILDKESGEIEHDHFYNLDKHLHAGDVLVVNNSKVFPARLFGKKETGGKIEIFLLHQKENNNLRSNTWYCLVGGRGMKEGACIYFNKNLSGEIIQNNQDGTWLIEFDKSGDMLMTIIEKIGQVPLPPYIKRNTESSKFKETNKINNDRLRYQTVYANREKTGSVAAPTAGLHFTNSLINKLKNKGIIFEHVTLHVGLGTFAPVKTDNILKHKMHAEWIDVDAETITRLNQAKEGGQRIIAVGTTSARTLETIFSKLKNSKEKEMILKTGIKAWTEIFIYPGYEFKIVDAIITNFHLPKSTLLMLISALADRNKITRSYNEAIRQKYRFYSYGDAMLIK